MYLIHGSIFLGLFLIGRMILLQFVVDPSFWTLLIPVFIASFLAPKPHVVKTQSGNQYGLRWMFTKKIMRL